jgi:hypothetical protein
MQEVAALLHSILVLGEASRQHVGKRFELIL